MRIHEISARLGVRSFIFGVSADTDMYIDIPATREYRYLMCVHGCMHTFTRLFFERKCARGGSSSAGKEDDDELILGFSFSS